METNEEHTTTYPTPEQVEAARAEYDRSEDMCAALVAAAGVTPQEPARVEEALRFCTCSHWLEAHQDRECLEFACVCKKFSPVVQVDEAKLADVIWGEQESRVLDGYVIHTRETAATTARTVAEWLRGGGQ